jgi:crotonobetainyl-CoA:carnitine CoA-transferase CaiB-like acyl-CoA transferase
MEPKGEPALAGIRVVDFSHFVAGPFCTMLLGDLGAEVIKIENAARGDDMRRIGPQVAPGQSAPFLWTNRNKQGMALDLANEAGREVAKALIAHADIVVENFSAGVMRRFGLDYDTVSPDLPRLIYCTISAFRRDGRFAKRSGFDPMIQAETGFMSLNGFLDSPPVRTGPAIMDISTSLMACNAVLAALAARSRTGRGQRVEVSLFDTAVTMLGFHAMNHLATGANPTRFGNHSPDTAPMGLFHAADGPLYIACANDQTFRQLAVEVLGRPELAAAPDYATNADRVKNREKLAATLNDALGRHTRLHWKQRMEAAGVPAGSVRTVAEAMTSEEMQDAGLLSRIPHPTAGSVANIAAPLRLQDTPVVDPVAAPTLGQHRDAILSRLLGYDERRIATLVQAGAFGGS